VSSAVLGAWRHWHGDLLPVPRVCCLARRAEPPRVAGELRLAVHGRRDPVVRKRCWMTASIEVDRQRRSTGSCPVQPAWWRTDKGKGVDHGRLGSIVPVRAPRGGWDL
jgi:hypothetical protein